MQGEGLQEPHCSPQGLGSESLIVPRTVQGQEREGAFPRLHHGLGGSLALPHLPLGLGGWLFSTRLCTSRPSSCQTSAVHLGFWTMCILPEHFCMGSLLHLGLHPLTVVWSHHRAVAWAPTTTL